MPAEAGHNRVDKMKVRWTLCRGTRWPSAALSRAAPRAEQSATRRGGCCRERPAKQVCGMAVAGVDVRVSGRLPPLPLWKQGHRLGERGRPASRVPGRRRRKGGCARASRLECRAPLAAQSEFRIARAASLQGRSARFRSRFDGSVMRGVTAPLLRVVEICAQPFFHSLQLRAPPGVLASFIPRRPAASAAFRVTVRA